MSTATLAISSSVSPDEAPDAPIETREEPELVVKGNPPLILLYDGRSLLLGRGTHRRTLLFGGAKESIQHTDVSYQVIMSVMDTDRYRDIQLLGLH